MIFFFVKTFNIGLTLLKFMSWGILSIDIIQTYQLDKQNWLAVKVLDDDGDCIEDFTIFFDEFDWETEK